MKWFLHVPKLGRQTLDEGVVNHNTLWHFLSSYRVWNTVQLKSVRIKASSPRPLVIPVLNSTNRIISGGRLRCSRLVCPSRPSANYPPGLGSGRRQPCAWRGSRTYHYVCLFVCPPICSIASPKSGCLWNRLFMLSRKRVEDVYIKALSWPLCSVSPRSFTKILRSRWEQDARKHT